MQEQRPSVQQILVSLQRVSSRNKDEIHYHKATLNLQSSGRDKVRTTPAWSHIPSATSLSSDRHFPRLNSEQWSEVLHVSTVKSRGSVVTLRQFRGLKVWRKQCAKDAVEDSSNNRGSLNHLCWKSCFTMCWHGVNVIQEQWWQKWWEKHETGTLYRTPSALLGQALGEEPNILAETSSGDHSGAALHGVILQFHKTQWRKKCQDFLTDYLLLSKPCIFLPKYPLFGQLNLRGLRRPYTFKARASKFTTGPALKCKLKMPCGNSQYLQICPRWLLAMPRLAQYPSQYPPIRSSVWMSHALPVEVEPLKPEIDSQGVWFPFWPVEVCQLPSRVFKRF